MIHHKVQTKVAVGFMGAMILTASLDLLGWRNKKIASDEADSVAHAYSVMGQLELTLEHVVDVETGARWFAATGQEQFLATFYSAQVSLIQDLRGLRTATADDPHQSSWLVPLVADVGSSVASNVNMVAGRRRTKKAALSAQFERGKNLADVVRGEIRARQTEETKILTRRVHRTDAKRKQSDIVILASTVVELSLLAFAWVAVSRALLASARTQSEIGDSNIQLGRRTAELEAANKELEAFTYSVSHDLRAPLRHIAGFSRILVEEFGETLAPEAQKYLERITQGSRRMGILVDELLALAGVGRHTLSAQNASLNSLLDEVISILDSETRDRQVEWKIADLGSANCDPALLRQVSQNLIANALKFTRPRPTAVIEIGRTEESGESIYFVRDNGVGFDMKYADKLFGVFQRLHRSDEFEGTGIGLATVRRIIQKHAGRTWAHAETGNGAAFYFTLNPPVGEEIRVKSATAGG